MTFYDGGQFPAEYRGDIFAAQHGSWNRKVALAGTRWSACRCTVGRATGEYEDFLTGFVTPAGESGAARSAWRSPRTARLMVTDDGSNSIWRVSYVGKK